MHFTDVVHWALDAPNSPMGGEGVRCIYLHGFGSQGLLALGSERASGSWDLAASWLSGPEVASRSWDPTAVWHMELRVGSGD
jgi:ketol-acid reductoisomerase